jgi:hypothetical protein
MMEVFAKRYYTQNCRNPHIDMPFAGPDTAYILAYSCIMLNTDAHNPNVKRKMSRGAWLFLLVPVDLSDEASKKILRGVRLFLLVLSLFKN